MKQEAEFTSGTVERELARVEEVLSTVAHWAEQSQPRHRNRRPVPLEVPFSSLVSEGRKHMEVGPGGGCVRGRK